MMTVLYSGAWAGTGYIDDINSGVMDQYLTSPISRTAIISGQLAQQLIINVVAVASSCSGSAGWPVRATRAASAGCWWPSASRRSSRRSSAAPRPRSR